MPPPDSIPSAAPVRVLFVCSRNRRRSLTAEEVFRSVPGIDARSAGTQPGARVPLTAGLIGWADVVLFMEASHRQRAQERFPEALAGRRSAVLRIPDDYEYMDESLVAELESRVPLALDALFD